jgi:hypothetical protein
MALSWTGTEKSFHRDHINESAQRHILISACVTFFLCLVIACYLRRRRLQLQREGLLDPLFQAGQTSSYSASSAWAQAGAFFSACVAASWALGVLDAAFFHPTYPGTDYESIGFTSSCFTLVLLCYWIIWPLGTVTYGRRRSFVFCTIFGAVDGACEAMLFLCIWAAIELCSTLPRYLVLAVAFLFKHNNQILASPGI